MAINQKNFFLISFLPALAYWYLEANYSLRVALAGGLLLAIIEIVLEKVFTKHIHALSKFNFFLIFFLGLISFLGDEGIWFKLQPFFTGLIMGSYIFYQAFKGKGLMYEMMETTGRVVIPYEHWNPLEKRMGFLLIFYGVFMAFIAFKASTDSWLFWKTAGFYIVFAFYMGGEIFFMRAKVRKLARDHKISKP